MPTKKERAQHFLKLTSKGNSREAFKLYVDQNFKHHNVYFKGDANTLMIAMEEDAKVNPNKIFEIQRALEDGDLVAVHSRFRQNPNDTDLAVIHIFRFEKEKIVELWDFAQAAPAEMINENGMF
ncbi:MAG: polyketide cyclase [Bacteroidetes bacterium HGW-Bacteroidetes-3]|jgi:predicted SnoaL-like aldol condensation-catalyzing enzyme|nr:MAG: polyketide cyclase [Bacteroidetes bacterium HGW-Bacteroidetes-3]